MKDIRVEKSAAYHWSKCTFNRTYRYIFHLVYTYTGTDTVTTGTGHPFTPPPILLPLHHPSPPLSLLSSSSAPSNPPPHPLQPHIGRSSSLLLPPPPSSSPHHCIASERHQCPPPSPPSLPPYASFNTANYSPPFPPPFFLPSFLLLPSLPIKSKGKGSIVVIPQHTNTNSSNPPLVPFHFQSNHYNGCKWQQPALPVPSCIGTHPFSLCMIAGKRCKP